jgi:hypothetical protein
VRLWFHQFFDNRGCPKSVKLDVKGLLQVPNVALSAKYLVMSSDVESSKYGAFRCVKDYLWSKVQGWIEKTMSSAGKEVLVKVATQAVLVYSMSCFRLPRGLCEHLNMLIRKFWWGSKDGHCKSSRVSWELTHPKSMSGLGFKDFELFNLVLLTKQSWRIPQCP